MLPLEGLSAEEFGKRMLALAAVSKKIADALARASTEGDCGPSDGLQPDTGENDFMRV
ncbi:MAG: hypothetical protein IKO72_10670 [Kiritimatiellae bacterium]|nr:hypothetical protein [Kiritimatiellia bacterium]